MGGSKPGRNPPLSSSQVQDIATFHRRLDAPSITEAQADGFVRVGKPLAGEDMVFNFPALIAHICKTRNCRAGSIVGSGTVSNKDSSVGYACIAEKRCLETIETGAPVTEFMKFGDSIRIEMLDEKGASIFGAIDQVIAPPGAA